MQSPPEDGKRADRKRTNSTETFSDGEMGGAMQKSAGSIMHRAEVPEESLKGLG